MPARKPSGSSVTGIDKVAEALESGVDVGGEEGERPEKLAATVASVEFDELLDDVWSDVPVQLRPVATATLAAHLDKLEEEQVLPADVERPRFERTEW